MAQRYPVDNHALIQCLLAIQPADLVMDAWLKRAGLGKSFFGNLQAGSAPTVYNLERLVRVAGYSLPAFWLMVEAERNRKAGK